MEGMVGKQENRKREDQQLHVVIAEFLTPPNHHRDQVEAASSASLDSPLLSFWHRLYRSTRRQQEQQ